MSLTNTATFTRKLIIGLGVILGGGLISLIVYNIGLGVYKSFFPEKPPPPLIAFGKLPPVNLEEGFEPTKNVNFRLETVTGDLPELPSTIKVFAVEAPEAKFGDAARTDTWATTLDFETPAISSAGGVSTYANKEGDKTFKIGVVNQKAEIGGTYLSNIKLISSKHRGDDIAKNNADKVVRVFGLNPVFYPETKVQFTRYRIDAGSLAESIDLASANLIQVNYFREDIDKIPVVYPQINKAKVWVLTSSDDFVAAKIDDTKIQEYKFTTYPLKGVVKAYEELKAGGGSFNKQLAGEMFDVRDVKIAYLDTDRYQPYLQPVYMFEGNDGINAYIPAVHDNFVNKQPN